MRFFLGLIALAFVVNTQAACVVLLHGLARSASSMSELEGKLLDNGFHPVNVDYPSRQYPIEELAERYVGPALMQCPQDEPVHFITHSMGGIIVRQYLSRHQINGLGRVVMLGPPNQGSEVVDTMGSWPGFSAFNGPAGLQLTTDANSLPNRLGVANFDVGIVAGNKSINLILSTMIPGADDGKVAVERTKLDSMRDFIVMPVSHPFLMTNDAVIEQAIRFLKSGSFSQDF